MFDSVLMLPGGRRLGYAEYGAKSGYPVFLFHGVPGSRFQAFAYLSTRDTQQLRIIVPERPGYGLSDVQRDRTVLDHVADVHTLADYLEIDRFSVVGISGGGSYALASAYALPNQVDRVAVLAGIAPMQVPGMIDECAELERLLFSASEAGKGYVNQMVAAVHNHPDATVEHIASRLPAADRALVTKDLVPVYRDMIVEALRTADGMLDDYSVLANPWGFAVEDIQTPVHLWHSVEDEAVFMAHSEYLSTHLPNSVLHTLSGVGHLGTPLCCYPQVVDFLQTGLLPPGA